MVSDIPIPIIFTARMYCSIYVGVGFMRLNATFNTISVISWRSVLLVEETRVPEERITDLPQVTENFLA